MGKIDVGFDTLISYIKRRRRKRRRRNLETPAGQVQVNLNSDIMAIVVLISLRYVIKIQVFKQKSGALLETEGQWHRFNFHESGIMCTVAYNLKPETIWEVSMQRIWNLKTHAWCRLGT